MNTETLLKEAYTLSKKEKPGDKTLHRSIGAVILRHFKSRDNSKFVHQLGGSAVAEATTQTATHTDSLGKKYRVYEPGMTDEQKKTSADTLSPRTAVGKGIEEKMKALGSKIQEQEEEIENEEVEEEFEEEEIGEQAEPLNEGNEEQEEDPMLNMTVDEFIQMYGDLPKLKLFAKETLGIKFAANSSAEKVVALIKQKIRDEAN
jgi:TolA-binding protein